MREFDPCENAFHGILGDPNGFAISNICGGFLVKFPGVGFGVPEVMILDICVTIADVIPSTTRSSIFTEYGPDLEWCKIR